MLRENHKGRSLATLGMTKERVDAKERWSPSAGAKFPGLLTTYSPRRGNLAT
jgi:hypothetical protein